MTPDCAAPVPWEKLVAYWARDLPDSTEHALEEHLFGCPHCTRESARVAQVCEALRGLIPPVLSHAKLAELLGKGLRVHENPMQPGERREVRFPEDADILLHVLGGLALHDVTRVSFALYAEQDGQVLADLPDVPFDPKRGAILVACQKHYASMPHDTVAEVRIYPKGGSASVLRYTILHRYPE